MSDADRPDGLTLSAFAALGSAWSITIPLSRVAGTAGVPPLVFPMAQAVGAVITLGFVLAFVRRRGFGRPFPWLLFIVAGTLGHALPQFIVFLATQRLPIGVVGLIISLNPLATAAVGALSGDRPLTGRALAGILIGLCGVALIALPGAALPGTEALPWLLLALLVPLSFGLANVWTAHLRRPNSDAVANAVGMMAVSALFLMIAVPLFGQTFNPASNGFDAGDGALLTHAAIAGPAFFLFFTVIARGGPLMVAQASYVILLLSTVWGWLFFGERPGGVFVIAAALVVFGLFLAITSGRRRTVP